MDVLQRPLDLTQADESGMQDAHESDTAIAFPSSVRLLPALPLFSPPEVNRLSRSSRPQPPNLFIPTSPSLPLFSAFPPRPADEHFAPVPVRTSSISCKETSRAIGEDQPVDLPSSTPTSPALVNTLSRFSRRTSLARTPSFEALSRSNAQLDDPPNPLSHTWGLGSCYTSVLSHRRQRRATVCARSSGDVAAMAEAARHMRNQSHGSHDDEWIMSPMSVSVDGHDSMIRHHQRQDSSGYMHALPPGALPAVDPSSATTFELIAQEQYAALGGKKNSPTSPIRVVRVPSRSTSRRHVGPPFSSPPKLLRLELSKPQQFDAPSQFTYGTNPESQYIIQSISTLGVSRPLVSPALSERRRSPGNQDYFSDKMTTVGLGIDDDEQSPERMLPPRGPFSGYLGDIAASHIDGRYDAVKMDSSILDDNDRANVDRRASLLSTLGGSSATASHDFALSSASTSLSRSAKNGKEGGDREGDAVQQAIDDPYMTEASVVRNERKRRLADQRKYILVELVETEVGYTEHLRDLVRIYLPQLAALPIVSEQQRVQIARNLQDLAQFHEYFSSRLVDILREESVGCEAVDLEPVDDVARIDRIARKIGAVFVEEAPGFSIYDDYCSGSASAMDVIRSIQYRPEWMAYEKRCRVVVAAKASATLSQLLAEDAPAFSPDNFPPVTLSSQPSRLQLRDLLILPIQRVCRYPLVLATLVGNPMSPSPCVERTGFDLSDCGGGSDVDEALSVMRTVARHADEANRGSLMNMRTAAIVSRLEDHAVITRQFVRSLGDCVLSGTLDVICHSHAHPITSPAKVRYLGAFLYGGYLLLVKAKRPTTYEVRHYLPLEMCDMIDVTEGFFAHSIRLRLNEHAFDLACSSAREKDIWAAALVQARDSACLPPFNLPCSVPPSRSRRMSTAGTVSSGSTPPTPAKRHSMVLLPGSSDWPDNEFLVSPTTSRALPFGNHTLPAKTSTTVVTHRASPLARAGVDRNLSDVLSEECLACRSRPYHQQDLFRPWHGSMSASASVRQKLSLKDNHVLRRRPTEVQSDIDENRGMRMSLSRTVSTYAGKRNSMIKRGFSVGSHDGFTALAVHSQDVMASSPGESSFGLVDSPTLEQAEFVTSASDVETARPRLLTNRSESDSSTNAPTLTVRRKSSFSSLIASVRIRPSTRARSVPASPNPFRPISLVQDDKCVPPSTSLVLEVSVAGQPLLHSQTMNMQRPQSTIFGKTFRSKSFDGSVAMVCGPPESTESSPGTFSEGLPSQNGSPITGSSALASSEELADGPNEFGASQSKASMASPTFQNHSEGDVATTSGDQANKPVPRRQKSMRFFGLNRFTRISGGAT